MLGSANANAAVGVPLISGSCVCGVMLYRTIPLPEGAITDQARATFNSGVLEITMPAPPDQVTRGRRLEIKDTTK